MATFTKFNAFVEDLAEKKHNLGSDILRVALCASENAPVAANYLLASLTVISYTNITEQRTVTVTTSAQTGGQYVLDANDTVLTATGNVAGFRYVVLYNDTASSDELIGFYDYGSTVTLTSGETFTIQWGSSGILNLT